MSRWAGGSMAHRPLPLRHHRGARSRSNAQPLVIRHIKGRMALAHNGNLTNAAELREEFELAGRDLPHHHRHGGHRLRHHQRAPATPPASRQAVERPWTSCRGPIRLVVIVARAS